MSWYNNKGCDSDVVLSTRVRFARNIKDYPFSPVLDETGASEIIDKVKRALSELELSDMRTKSEIEKQSLVEKHIISPAFAVSTAPAALLTNKDNTAAVMVCEEDHIRLQTIFPGFALKEAFEYACELDDKLDASLSYAYNEKLGYLTHCPTNLGTGMRASVMIFLPALTKANLLKSYIRELEKLGITLRGMYGEGSEAKAYIYQLSNSITMGITEEETISKLESVVRQLITNERSARKKLVEANYDFFCDRASRALGLMKSAYIMSSGEFLKLFADVKLGTDEGLIDGTDDLTLNSLLVGLMPATLLIENGIDSATDTERDKLRAKTLKKTLK